MVSKRPDPVALAPRKNIDLRTSSLMPVKQLLGKPFSTLCEKVKRGSSQMAEQLYSLSKNCMNSFSSK